MIQYRSTLLQHSNIKLLWEKRFVQARERAREKIKDKEKCVVLFIVKLCVPSPYNSLKTKGLFYFLARVSITLHFLIAYKIFANSLKFFLQKQAHTKLGASGFMAIKAIKIYNCKTRTFLLNERISPAAVYRLFITFNIRWEWKSQCKLQWLFKSLNSAIVSVDRELLGECVMTGAK